MKTSSGKTSSSIHESPFLQNLNLPKDLVQWTSFTDEVNRFVSNINNFVSLQSDSLSKMISHWQIQTEEQIYEPFIAIVWEYLNNFYQLFQFQFSKSTRMEQMGNPDFGCRRWNASQNKFEMILPVEIKHPRNFPTGKDIQNYILCATYQSHREKISKKNSQKLIGDKSSNIYNGVNQVWAYMKIGHFRYGILTTYSSSFFFKRDEYDNLYVSPEISYTSLNPSVLACFVYLGYSAFNSFDGSSPTKQ